MKTRNILFAVILSVPILAISASSEACNPKDQKVVTDTVSTKAAVEKKERITGIKAGRKPETPFKSNNSLLNKSFDFNVQTLNKGVFTINFINASEKPVSIKIYDLIGNLILLDEISVQGQISRKYNFSSLKMDYFIIEVGNARYNNAKKIFVS
jgi:hypothetical protein